MMRGLTIVVAVVAFFALLWALARQLFAGSGPTTSYSGGGETSTSEPASNGLGLDDPRFAAWLKRSMGLEADDAAPKDWDGRDPSTWPAGDTVDPEGRSPPE